MAPPGTHQTYFSGGPLDGQVRDIEGTPDEVAVVSHGAGIGGWAILDKLKEPTPVWQRVYLRTDRHDAKTLHRIYEYRPCQAP